MEGSDSTNPSTGGESASPSPSFRVTIAGIKKTFPRVENISTSTLAAWMHQNAQDDDQTDDDQTDEAAGSTTDEDVKRNLVLFDVRPLEEHDVSRIPSAIHLDPNTEDMEQVKRRIQQHSHKAGDIAAAESNDPITVVMYCSVGYRSSAMADKMMKTFYSHKDMDTTLKNLKVYNLEGSIFKWANENRTIVDVKGQSTQFIHPYSRLWGLLVDRSRWKWSISND